MLVPTALAAAGDKPSRLRKRIARLLSPPGEPNIRLGRAWTFGIACLLTAIVFFPVLPYVFAQSADRNADRNKDKKDKVVEPAKTSPKNEALDERVRLAWRFGETSPTSDGIPADDDGPARNIIVNLGIDDLMEHHTWSPQIHTLWKAGREYAVHMPLWALTETLPVDLCFAVEIKVIESGEVFKGDPIIVPKGEKANFYFSPKNVHRFWKKYNGYVPMVITLTPFKPKEPRYSKLTNIWQGTLVSKPLRVKSYQFKISEAPPFVRELRSMLSELAGIDIETASANKVHKALLAKGIKKQAAYHLSNMASLNPYNRWAGTNVTQPYTLEMIPFLIKMLEDDKSLPFNPPSNAAERGLRNLGHLAVPALIEQLKHKKPAMRVKVVYLFNNMADNKRREKMNPLVLPHLLRLLDDGHEPLRVAVSHALHRYPDKRAVGPLVRALLDDKSPKVRANAAMALGWNRDARAVPALAKTLSDTENQVRQEVATALGIIGSPECFNPLARALLKDTSHRVRHNAAYGLAALKDTRAEPLLLIALKDGNEGVVSAAAYGLGELKSQSAIGPLIQTLKLGPNARRSAARALKKITGHGFGENAARWKIWYEKKRVQDTTCMGY